MSDAVASVRQGDVDRVGVPEQVVEISEDFLVGTDEKHAQVVGLAVVRVQLEHALHVAQLDELVDLPVGIAREVGDDAPARGSLLEPVQGQDREQLLDRPVVGRGLKHREVSIIGVRQSLLEAF